MTDGELVQQSENFEEAIAGNQKSTLQHYCANKAQVETAKDPDEAETWAFLALLFEVRVSPAGAGVPCLVDHGRFAKQHHTSHQLSPSPLHAWPSHMQTLSGSTLWSKNAGAERLGGM